MINGIFLITSVKKNTFLENQLIQDHKKQQIPHNIVQAPCRHHYILCSISNHEEKCPNPSGGKSLWRKGHTPQQTLSSVIYLIIQDRMYSNTLIFPLILQLPPADFSHRTIVLLPGSWLWVSLRKAWHSLVDEGFPLCHCASSRCSGAELAQRNPSCLLSPG